MSTAEVMRTDSRETAVGRRHHCRCRSESGSLPLEVSGKERRKERKVDRRSRKEVRRMTEMMEEEHRMTEREEELRRTEREEVLRMTEKEGELRRMMEVDVSRGIEMMVVAHRRIEMAVVRRNRNRNWEVDLGNRTC
jgi:hypothetical protein